MTNGYAVTLQQLEFSWHQQAPTILSLEMLNVAAGEQVFIEGPSGSGKSTLLSLLAGVTTPQRGRVEVLGREISQLSAVQRDHFRAHHIGYIFQQFNLIPYLSMVENVTLPCRFSPQRRNRALENAATVEEEALRLLSHLDMADDKMLARPVTSLSVGQQQRVAAARALMGSPELLIADEPTSALDSSRREGFIKLLFEECKQTGSTLLFVSHDASLKHLFSRTIHLADINAAAQVEEE
ncbi:MAG: ABC transporter ATP-binding protein [Chromatiales bacterium]|nr:ABC transporter ATP-binding protein [Chromatiales bacterium]